MDLVIGRKINESAIDSLINDIESLKADEADTLYIGYPMLATEDEPVTLSAVLISKQFGFVVFDTQSELQGNKEECLQAISNSSDTIVRALSAKLYNYKELFNRRDFAIKINVFTYFPSYPSWIDDKKNTEIISSSDFKEKLSLSKPIDEAFMPPLVAAIQRVSSLRPKIKRDNIRKSDSYGSIIKNIEKKISELDSHQKKAAIESPDGPQRIRGLAGSGKTIVLALKAAYLHALYPEWTIAVTFYTRSLRPQFKRLIRKFYFEDRREEPNWDRLKVLHAYGSNSQEGVYSVLCSAHGVQPKDFGYAKRTYGYDKAFQGVCSELLKIVEVANPKVEVFDALLIDEAQDIPKEFLRLAYHCTKKHRFVWAYDDLQNLGAYQTETLKGIFGVDSAGIDLVRLENEPRKARQDVILPKCYRNTPWALVTAHAIGAGIYRTPSKPEYPKLIQHPDDPQLWTEIGYRKISGDLQLGKVVTLERDPNSTPDFFREYLTHDDAVKFWDCQDDLEQLNKVADAILKNITDDELYPHDILVVFPDALEASQRGTKFMQILADRKIRSHVAGVTSSVDEYFIEGRVTISGAFRAKGNEAPMVYAMDSQYGARGGELIKRRNILFTTITRSRGWIRICGYGDGMAVLKKEFEELIKNNFRLIFKVPDSNDLKMMRTQHRDMSLGEKKKLSEVETTLSILLGDDDEAGILRGNLPDELRRKLIKRLTEGEDE